MANSDDGPLSIESTTGEGGRIPRRWRRQSTARRQSAAPRPFPVDPIEAGGAIEMRFTELGYFNSSNLAGSIQIILGARHGDVRPVTEYGVGSTSHAASFGSLRAFERDDGPPASRAVGA